MPSPTNNGSGQTQCGLKVNRENYTYDDGDKLLEVNWPGGSKLYTYDGAGRPTQITSPTGNYLFTWNSQSQLTQLTGPSGTQQFSYNGSGARASITKGGVTDQVVRDGTGVLGSIVRQGGQEFKPGVAVQDGLNTIWQHSGLKNLDWQSTGTATISGTNQFDAFGNQIGSTGSWTGPFTHAGSFGYQSDGDIPFQQVGHRWLDPTTGRFLTRDPVKDGRNWYAYGAGLSNPLTMVDPTGLVQVIVFWYPVPPGWPSPWFHTGLIIIDNAKGGTEPVWSFSGGPSSTLAGVPSGPLRSWSGPWRPGAGTQDYDRWDGGGVIIVNDDSPAGPWIEKFQQHEREMAQDASPDYALWPLAPNAGNSNSWLAELLRRSDLMDEFEKAIGKRGGKPAVPGWDKNPWKKKPPGGGN